MLEQNFTDEHACAQCAGAKNTQSQQRLVDYSPGDKPWDVHRSQADAVHGVYLGTQFDGLAGRIAGCSGFLGFGWADDPDSGESRLRLRSARFCRVRHCPVCQWRRSLMWQARFYQAIPSITAAHPGARWAFLTLTVRNMPIDELRAGLVAMNKAWHRFVQRPEFAGNVLGWIRTTEVTRQRGNDYAHPHFHVLLMLRPSYFGKGYVKQEKWADLWRDCARLDYQPVVDIRTVRPKRGAPDDAGIDAALRGAVSETLKYAVKPSDMQDAWLLKLTEQVHRLRFIAAGGALKDALKIEQETEQDLLLADAQQATQNEAAPLLMFDWQSRAKHYVKR